MGFKDVASRKAYFAGMAAAKSSKDLLLILISIFLNLKRLNQKIPLQSCLRCLSFLKFNL